MADWHPRGNAYPVAWSLRNGRWGEPYAIVQQIEDRVEGRRVLRYELRTPHGQPLGTFPTGDDAAVYAWEWHLRELSEQHARAARRQHERPGYANTPERTERD